MSAFCSAEDVAALLQVAVSEYAAAVTRAIVEASAAVQGYCRQVLEYVEDETVALDCAGGTRLLLPEMPVVEVSAVVEDGEALTPTDDYVVGQHGILHRVGRRWASGPGVVSVTYSHGYVTLPEIVVAVTTRAAARVYQAGLRAAETAGVPGITATALGDYSVSFSGEAGSGGDGVLGVSAAAMLLRSEKEALSRYRV